MISSYFHAGSGAGDQLFRFITSRTLAEKLGVPHGMETPEHCKVLDFIKLPPFFTPAVYTKKWEEKCIRDENGIDVRSFDPESQFLQPNTIIDGSFEDSKYWGHNLENIAKWLITEPLEVPDDTCLIGFRGGEYKAVSELFLPKSYYFRGVEIMKGKNLSKFEVHTDDPSTAKEFFPDFPIVENTAISHSKHSNMGYNWRAMRNAKYAIIPNSAFYILPRLLKHFEDPTAVTIAPRYWARYNSRTWARPSCFYKPFSYIHAEDSN